MPIGPENVKLAIESIGKSLIDRADDISRDLNYVSSISINAKITPEEVVNFDVIKNYYALDRKEEQ